MFFTNKPETCLEFSECFALRQDSRIVGSFIGTLGQAPRQIQQSGLPLLLSQVEVDLLLSLNRAKLCRFKNPHQFSEDYLNKMKLHQEMSYQQQIELCKNERKEEIMKLGDKIVEGKKKKRKQTEEDDDDIVIIDKDNILEKEVSKIGTLSREQSLVQIFHGQPWLDPENQEDIQEWIYKGKLIKKQVFHDLWHQGFFITNGSKFGGDYLVYPGDPIQFHAKYIVVCCDNHDVYTEEKDLVAKSRLGTNVKKTVLLASYDNHENKVKYKAIKWTQKD